MSRPSMSEPPSSEPGIGTVQVNLDMYLPLQRIGKIVLVEWVIRVVRVTVESSQVFLQN